MSATNVTGNLINLQNRRQTYFVSCRDTKIFLQRGGTKRALDQGIVTITVANENFEDIEAATEKRFGLKKCFIVPKSYYLLAVKQSPGRAGLQLLRRIVGNQQVIGLAWGTSIR